MKIFSRSLIVAAALSLGTGYAVADVKIGFMATMSGPAAALGQDQYDAFMLAIEQGGGKLGGVAVSVVKEDDQLKPDLGVQLVKKLIDSDKVDLVSGLTFSNVMMAIAKPLGDSGVPFVGSNAGPAPLAGDQCRANFVFASYQNDNQSEVLGQYAVDKGYQKMMLMAPNYQSGKDQVVGFKRFYKGPVVAEVFTQLNQPDYSAEIAQIQMLQPDAIFAFFPGGMGVNFIKQMNQSGLLKKVPLLTVSTVDGTTLPAIGAAAEGVLAGGPWGPDLPGQANADFVKAFEAKYQRIPSQYAAQAYDSAHLIGSALQATGGNVSDRPAFLKALHEAKFDSVRTNFKIGANGFPVQDEHVYEIAKDAQGRVSLKAIATPLKSYVDAYASQCKPK
jgi:branched-chain amino acid transport system substrate-binding protein